MMLSVEVDVMYINFTTNKLVPIFPNLLNARTLSKYVLKMKFHKQAKDIVPERYDVMRYETIENKFCWIHRNWKHFHRSSMFEQFTDNTMASIESDEKPDDAVKDDESHVDASKVSSGEDAAISQLVGENEAKVEVLSHGEIMHVVKDTVAGLISVSMVIVLAKSLRFLWNTKLDIIEWQLFIFLQFPFGPVLSKNSFPKRF